MKLSDYVFEFLADRGVDTVYLVSGGGIMHLLESVGRNPRLRYVCNYHEQACAIAAEAHARITGVPAVCLVTTGPGAANAASGMLGPYFDSIPMIVISGQVRTQVIADYSKLRQLGPQELDTESMARPVTKVVSTVRDPRTIRCVLERAFHLATTGRPGPAWIDLPLDVQAADVEVASLVGYEPPPSGPSPAEISASADRVLAMLERSRRPLIVASNGVRLSGGVDELRQVMERFRVPAVETLSGMDLLEEEHPLYAGRIGPVGQRRGNFALQNADLVIGVGASFSIASIGFNFAEFAPRAKKVLVNVDPAELGKPTLQLDLAVEADARALLCALLERGAGSRPPERARWLEACGRWRARYPAVTEEHRLQARHVNSYVFVDALCDALPADAVVLTGNSLDAATVYQAFRLKRGQRVFTNCNCGAMGWDLPAAIGACIAAGRRRTVLVTGDGSIQFNLQELLTVQHLSLPLAIFVFSNDGYQAIRATQDNFFQGHYVGSNAASGVASASFERLAAAFGLAYLRVERNEDVPARVAQALATPGAVLCEVVLSPSQERIPRSRAFRRPDGTLESRPLEDMYPYLPREELHANMHLFDDEA